MRWAVNPDVVWVDTADEVRLYDTETGEFQGLNQSAAAIWRQLVEHGDPDRVVEALCCQFAVPDDGGHDALIAADVDRFIRRIADLGLVVQQSHER
jgi:hypothetical protein